MSSRFNEIFLGLSGFTAKPQAHKLSDLSRVNLFVGANSSGKSMMLRHLAFQKIEQYQPQDEFLKSSKQWYLDFCAAVREKAKDSPLIKTPYEQNKVIDSLFLPETAKATDLLNRISEIVTSAAQAPIWQPYKPEAPFIKEEVVPLAKEFVRDFPAPHEYKKLYIPVIRGLRPYEEKKNVYLDRTKKDYFEKMINDNIESEKGIDAILLRRQLSVFTGLELYEELRKNLLGAHQNRKLVRDFEEFLSRSFFDERPVALTPRDGEDVVYVKIGEEDDYPIYNLGDGIQQILILTFPLFMRRDKRMFFFIEEPEIHMHPGLQKKFLQTIATTKGMEKFIYFMTTHSNHFLDLSLDQIETSIYTFRKEEKSAEKEKPTFVVDHVRNDDFSSLELLGVKQSSVFLSNCTIWVEGITDRLYLHKYLELIMNIKQKKYIEGIHYTFAEYGGANITHWDFVNDKIEAGQINVKSICGHYFLVVDNDNAADDERKKKKKERLERLEQGLPKTDFCRLEGREIENMISEAALKKLIENAGGQKVIYNDYHKPDVKMGEYILSRFGDKKDMVPTKLKADDHGVLRDKKGLCQEVISMSGMNSQELLSDEARRVAGKILDFIEKNNKCE